MKNLADDRLRVQPKGIHRFAVPEKMTKELGVYHVQGKRKIRLSSNLLPLVGFEAGVKHDVNILEPLSGLRLSTSINGTQRVYEREYSKRRNNPLETLIEIGSQQTLNAAIPSYTERVHVTLGQGEIIIKPLPNRTFFIRKGLKESADPFNAMVALTAGVDARCLVDCGFNIEAVLEYRPAERHNKHRDLTETGALNVLANVRPRFLFNEDISRINWSMVKQVMNDSPQLGLLHISLQCDDYSPAKAKSLKTRAVADLSTSKDLFYDALRCVEELNPASVLLEQVPGFGASSEGEVFVTKLRRWGYHVSEKVLYAPNHTGKTLRTRYYLFASVFPSPFEWPEMTERDKNFSLWGDIQSFLSSCRDISHTKTLQDGLITNRARLIHSETEASPTILKSQYRQAKDSIFIRMDDGTYRFPSIDLLKHLQGIPVDFNLDSVTSELAAEIIGQSVDFNMHHQLMMSIKKHIGENIDNRHLAESSGLH